MPWYLRSTGAKDTHRGLMSRGMVDAACRIRFAPVSVAFGRTALSGEPHDPGQVCPKCSGAEVAG